MMARYVLIIFCSLPFTIYHSPFTAFAQTGGTVVLSELIKGVIPEEDPMSPLWEQVSAVEFPLSAQVHWEPRAFSVTVKAVKVRSLHNGDRLAILLEYKDPTKDNNDAAAIEFPAGDKKAHFAHGQPMLQVEGGPVNIWYWKEDRVTDMSAQGFGTLKAQGQQDVTGKGVWKDGVWRVVFSRKLIESDPEDVHLIPGEFKQIAFAVWDGADQESGSKKAISSWWYFRAEAPPDPSLYLYTLLAVSVAIVFEVVLIRKIRRKPENG